MSSTIAFPFTPTISQAYSSNSQPISSSRGTLQARIELQRGKIQALELAVEERRRTEQLRNRERRPRLPAEERRVPDLQQDEQRRMDRQTWDDSAMQAHLRHKAAEEAGKVNNDAIRQRNLAETEERRLARIREKEWERERRQVLDLQQDEQRRKARQVRDESAMRAHLRHQAVAKPKKVQDAQDAEYQRLAKLREAERKRARQDEHQRDRQRQDEQHQRDRQRRDEWAIQAYLRYQAATQPQWIQLKDGQRQDGQHQRDRQRQDEWAIQARLRYETAIQPQWIQQRSLTQELDGKHRRDSQR